jgi:hypothetical protein
MDSYFHRNSKSNEKILILFFDLPDNAGNIFFALYAPTCVKQYAQAIEQRVWIDPLWLKSDNSISYCFKIYQYYRIL